MDDVDHKILAAKWVKPGKASLNTRGAAWHLVGPRFSWVWRGKAAPSDQDGLAGLHSTTAIPAPLLNTPSPPQTGPSWGDSGAAGEAPPLAADRVSDWLLRGQQPGSGSPGDCPQPGPSLSWPATSDPSAPHSLRRSWRHGWRHPVSRDAAM